MSVGIVEWTWGVGAVSYSSKGSVSSSDAKSGNSGVGETRGETAVEDVEPSSSESDVV
jgi:hypothetical protein